jgi:glycosyltransferase involved in cell wall biosynthesis
MKNPAAQPFLLQDFPAFQPSLRLAVVTETWPPEVNGVALTLARLVQGLCQRNHQVQLVRPRQAESDSALQGPRYEEVLMRGMPIPRYPQLKLGLPARKALVAAWTQARPDLVHIATEGPLGWSALQAARQLKLPVSSDFRTNFHSYSQHYGLAWLRKPIAAYLRKFHNHTQCTMVPTRALSAELLSSGFRHLEVVARGVDTQLFHPGRRSAALRTGWGADSDSPVLLVVGRLAAEKNLDLAISAYEAMRERLPAARLVFAGDGPLREALQRRCPQACFTGLLNHEQLAGCYASADALLFPSLTETFGNVTLEAMSSGLPVLAFDTAAAAEWVRHGHNGWLAPVNDVTAFVAQARALALAPELLAAARAPAREQVARLDWQQIAAQVEAVFNGVIARHGALQALPLRAALPAL